jgi:hypothetical protein
MVSTPEEVAVDFSRASLQAQEQTENQLREKATAVLSAASVVVPIAALGVGRGPAGAAIPLGAAAVAYFLCARDCGSALLPQNTGVGLLGSQLLEMADSSGAKLPQIQAAAANYLDMGYRHNRAILEESASRVRHAIAMLTVEILALVVALVITITS